MLKGFRDFILRGNVVDLAVAVILGAAFSAIVASLVADILNPLLAAIVGKPDFSYLVWNIHGGHIKYGNFFNAVIGFLMVASAIYFGVVLPLNKLAARAKALRPPPPPPPPSTKPCPECLSEIPLAAKRCAFCAQPVV
jgi:large conductance mechanosensitive channel